MFWNDPVSVLCFNKVLVKPAILKRVCRVLYPVYLVMPILCKQLAT